jgi:hypothetical protein
MGPLTAVQYPVQLLPALTAAKGKGENKLQSVGEKKSRCLGSSVKIQ